MLYCSYNIIENLMEMENKYIVVKEQVYTEM